MAKRYKYKDQIFCDDDLSEGIDNYGGDLFDLYWELKTAGEAAEWTSYSCTRNPEKVYDSPEELIEKEFDCLRERRTDG